MLPAKEIKQQLLALACDEKRQVLQRFFKTEKGQYGYGDKFLGVTVPQQRALIKQCSDVPLSEIEVLLHDEYHECRLTALLLLVRKFRAEKQQLVRKSYLDFYIANVDFINNWDLVDLSAPDIVGGWFLDEKDRSDLLRWAQSEHLWLQRIAIVGTLRLIRVGQFTDTLRVADVLLHHRHDLIQKAVGWMLREVGKRNFEVEYAFLVENSRYKTMPRTMLRYAIECFPDDLRRDFLKGFV